MFTLSKRKSITVSIIGKTIQQPEGYSAFVPNTFPSKKLITASQSLQMNHAEAMLSLGKLDGVTQLLPDKDFFILMFIRKDAASSSQIEGTNATMAQAIEAETEERSNRLPDDVDDILQHIKALNYGIKRLNQLPISLRLIKEIHLELMKEGRSSHPSFPGEFRRSQNWIGGTKPSNARFVPPPVHEMKTALDHLEKFMHSDAAVLPLIKAGLIHAQFETIHPFNDGNGRTGRMLVTLYLTQSKLLDLPVLYLSSFFKEHQEHYYEMLHSYHSEAGDPEQWLSFFLEGIETTAKSAINVCQQITELRLSDMNKANSLGKSAARSTLKILEQLYSQPIVGISEIEKWTGYSRQGAYKVIERLVELGILEPRGKKDYAQKYEYKQYLEIFTDK